MMILPFASVVKAGCGGSLPGFVHNARFALYRARFMWKKQPNGRLYTV